LQNEHRKGPVTESERMLVAGIFLSTSSESLDLFDETIVKTFELISSIQHLVS